jgi:Zn-dependent peptidase ImmA (M78 family)/transcriptional regulator with XRE-family HTH domain
MKPGTPGFIGARLREAREARQMSIVTLAELAGLSRQMISGYEHGDTTPQPESLYRLAAVLDMPASFFSLPARESDDSPTFFRSLQGATKSSRLAAEHRLSWVADIATELSAYVSFPAVAFPTVVLRGSTPLDARTIEQAATTLRIAWMLGDGPIANVVSLIEGKGGIVTRSEAESEAIDAFSKWLPSIDRPCIFLGIEKGSRARSRFDAAHEIGHMVMHRHVRRTQVATPAELTVLEAEAHSFASAFLLPAESFADDLYFPTVDGMLALKPKWKVSVAAMLKRATDLGIFDEGHARRMWMSLSRRGWRKGEPGDETIGAENPTALPRAFELVVQAGIRSATEMVEMMPFGVRDVVRHASLPDAFLDLNAPVRLIDRTPPREAVASGQVLPFRRPD